MRLPLQPENRGVPLPSVAGLRLPVPAGDVPLTLPSEFEMPPFIAFADIQTPHDLLKKLEHDFQRMQKDWNDVYAAFDFFVTAEHMNDWVKKATPEQWAELGGTTPRSLKKAVPVLAVVAHVANGAKHYKVSDEDHQSIKAAEVRRAIAKGYVEDGYVEEPVYFSLSEDAAQRLGLEVRDISAKALATLVLGYWREALSVVD